MAQVVTNPSPKARFQADPKTVSSHRDLVGSFAFQLASDHALMQHSLMLSGAATGDPNKDLALYHRMVGGQELLGIFRNLAETPAPPAKRNDTDNLDHKA